MSESMIFDIHRFVKRLTEASRQRRTGSEESRLPRQQKSETKGPRQPMLMDKPNPDGQAPLIFGHRRRRTIVPPSTVNPVDAPLRSDALDTFHHLPPWIVKKRHREAIPAIDLAHAIARLTDLYKQQGQNKSYVAQALHMSNTRFSKYLALAKAPQEIQDLSTRGELQDVELLYQLKKAYEVKPGAVVKLLEKWRNKELTTSLSRAVSQLMDRPQPERTASSPSSGGEPPNQQSATPTAKTVQRASAVALQSTDTGTHLIIEVGKKKFWFSLDPEACRALKDLARKTLMAKHPASFSPVNIHTLKALAQDPGSLLVYFLTPQGHELFLQSHDTTYKLYTARQKPRFFKCANTALRFAQDLGVSRLFWAGLNQQKQHSHVPIERNASHGTA